MEDQQRSIVSHLAELRRRLIVCLVALVVGMGIAWNFSTDLVAFVEKPLSGQTYLADLKKEVYAEAKARFPAIYDHYRLGQEIAVPVKPRMLNYSAPLEPFFVQCKIAMLAGFVLVLPVVLYQIWQFVAPGLTRKEKRLALPFIFASFVSFCLGAAFFLVIIWPVIINFSLSYESNGLQSWFNLSLYINFCLRLILIFGLIFELPIISLVLSRLGVADYRMLADNRRYAVLVSAIVAAFHADLITMLVVMIPIYLMYELSVWVVYFFGGGKQEAASPFLDVPCPPK